MRILFDLREATQRETGNVFYQLLHAEQRARVFATIEHWENEEAKAAHWSTDHLKRAVGQLGPLMIGEMRVSRYVRGDGQMGCI